MHILGKIGIFIQKNMFTKNTYIKLIIGQAEFQITHTLLHTSKHISLMSFNCSIVKLNYIQEQVNN